MAITVTFRGVQYTIPEPADAFTQAMTDYLNALSTGAVPYPTSADLDLGASFGIKALDFKTRSANPAASGLLRLAAGDTGLAWRNAANSADVGLTKDSGDNLLFAGANVTGNPMLGANTAAGQSIANGATPIVVFGTVELDTDSAYNSGTGRFTVPAGKGGHYQIDASISYTNAQVGATYVFIFKNAAELKRYQFTSPGGAQSISITAKANFAVGDIIDIRTAQPAGTPQALQASAVYNFMSIKRIPT